MGRRNESFIKKILKKISGTKNKETSVKVRESGASLPEEVRDMYKEELYKESAERSKEYPEKMKENIEIFKQQEEDFKKTIEVFQKPNHEEAQKIADIRQQQKSEREIYLILDEYIKENNINGDNVMTNISNGEVTLAYFNANGEIIRKRFSTEEVLAMKKKEIVE